LEVRNELEDNNQIEKSEGLEGLKRNI